MKLRIRSLLWVMALFASALATFGGIAGTYVAVVVLLFWGCAFARGAPSVWGILVAVLICLAIPVLLLTHIDEHPRYVSAVRSSCWNNLKNLVLAIENFHDRKKHLPQAHTVIDGKPAHSWRTLILPELGGAAMYEQIDLTEPWDSPRNQRVLRGLPILETGPSEEYLCPARQNNLDARTSYFAIVDPRTVWPPERPCRFEDIKDDLSTTVLLMEAPHKNVNWYEPRDLSFDEAVDLLTSDPPGEGLVGHREYQGSFNKWRHVINVVFADGRTGSISLPIDRDVAVAILTAAGGEALQRSDLQCPFETELDIAAVFAAIGFAAFLVTAALPALRYFRRVSTPRDCSWRRGINPAMCHIAAGRFRLPYRRYLTMHHRALSASRTPIFLPSS